MFSLWDIRRTISFIESGTNSKVIALVVFPMDLMEEWKGIYGAKKPLSDAKYSVLKSYLDQEFLIPIFKLGVEVDMLKFIDGIIEYFSE